MATRVQGLTKVYILHQVAKKFLEGACEPSRFTPAWPLLHHYSGCGHNPVVSYQRASENDQALFRESGMLPALRYSLRVFTSLAQTAVHMSIVCACDAIRGGEVYSPLYL